MGDVLTLPTVPVYGTPSDDGISSSSNRPWPQEDLTTFLRGIGDVFGHHDYIIEIDAPCLFIFRTLGKRPDMGFLKRLSVYMVLCVLAIALEPVMLRACFGVPLRKCAPPSWEQWKAWITKNINSSNSWIRDDIARTGQGVEITEEPTVSPPSNIWNVPFTAGGRPYIGLGDCDGHIEISIEKQSHGRLD